MTWENQLVGSGLDIICGLPKRVLHRFADIDALAMRDRMHSDAVLTFSLLREHATFEGLVGPLRRRSDYGHSDDYGLVLRAGRISNWCDRFRGERVVCHPRWAFAEGEVAAVDRLVCSLLVLGGA